MAAEFFISTKIDFNTRQGVVYCTQSMGTSVVSKSRMNHFGRLFKRFDEHFNKGLSYIPTNLPL
tara:strand:- start:874 stop:1065 length:192 start_codon:yes stop_codon:yes gene_type:complete